jgi:hypothetical protein
VFGTAETAAPAIRQATTNAAIFRSLPDQAIQKFIQSFESCGDTMKKNRPFVNLFLDESTIPDRSSFPKEPLSENGIVVFQTAIAHYSKSDGT